MEPSPYRIENECPYMNLCGGCTYGNISYEGQLLIKEKHVRDRLERIAELENPKVNEIVGAYNIDRYRNKATMPIWTGGIITRKGGIVENLDSPKIGFYAPKSHDVIDCQDCFLQSVPAMAAADAVRRFMEEDNITAYDPKWEKGLMRQMVVKTAFGTGEVMVVLVINGKGIPNGQKLVAMLDDAIYNLPPDENGMYYSLESVVLNVNKGKSNELFGEENITLAGKPVIRDEAFGLNFEISPLAFYQVNPEQTEKLYAKAIEYADITGEETVLDLYCGVGTIGLCAAAAGAGRVIGIEAVKGAVLDANRNAVINGIVNARYVCGRAEVELPKLMGKGPDADKVDADLRIKTADVVFLDPPRAGCDKALLDAVAEIAPEKIVYVSCDPATMSRDIKFLTERGYIFEEATPVDMFPHTKHVETVVLLSKGKIDSKKVRVEFSLEDMDMSGFQKGATYEQIKAYVLEHSGLKVSSLYISQIKRKCGLEVGQNYNLSKKEDAKVPQCPPEKESAIREALKFYNLI